MTEQESINMETQRQLAMQDAKFAMFMQELQQQREDIRRIQAKHDADMRDAQARHDADMKGLSKQLHDNFVQTLLGVGGMIVALGALILTSLK